MCAARRAGVVFTIMAAVALVGCTQSTTAPSTTTTTSSSASSGGVTVTASPPTFSIGIAGVIDVKLPGSPTKASTIKVDFGDSTTMTSSAVSDAQFQHAYLKTGTFKVNATVTMPDGSIVTAATEVSVLP